MQILQNILPLYATRWFGQILQTLVVTVVYVCSCCQVIHYGSVSQKKLLLPFGSAYICLIVRIAATWFICLNHLACLYCLFWPFILFGFVFCFVYIFFFPFYCFLCWVDLMRRWTNLILFCCVDQCKQIVFLYCCIDNMSHD